MEEGTDVALWLSMTVCDCVCDFVSVIIEWELDLNSSCSLQSRDQTIPIFLLYFIHWMN